MSPKGCGFGDKWQEYIMARVMDTWVYKGYYMMLYVGGLLFPRRKNLFKKNDFS
jgi:hypothetical protein